MELLECHFPGCSLFAKAEDCNHFKREVSQYGVVFKAKGVCDPQCPNRVPDHKFQCVPSHLKRFKELEAKQDAERKVNRKTAKQKRGFHRILSGTWKHRNERLYRLDLTEGLLNDPKFMKKWQILRKRVLRRWKFILNYVCVKAKGDKGGKIHLHLLYSVSYSTGTPVGEKLAWIPHSWISRNWKEISGFPVNFIQTVKDNHRSPKRVAGYFISQYFSGQNNYERMSYSWHWGFKGMARVWNEKFSELYKTNKADTIDAWHSLLDQTALNAYLPDG